MTQGSSHLFMTDSLPVFFFPSINGLQTFKCRSEEALYVCSGEVCESGPLQSMQGAFSGKNIHSASTFPHTTAEGAEVANSEALQLLELTLLDVM